MDHLDENNDHDFTLFADQYHHQGSSHARELYGINGSADFGLLEAFTYPRTMEHVLTPASTFGNGNPSYSEVPLYYVDGTKSPASYNLESSELRAPTSCLSTISGRSVASASSSIIGSPYSPHNHVIPMHPGLNPSIVPSYEGNYESFGLEYNITSGMDQDFALADFNKPGFVDPSLIHSYGRNAPTSAGPGNADLIGYQPNSGYPHAASPSPSHMSGREAHGARQGSQSPYLGNPYAAFPQPTGRRRSISNQSYGSPSSVFSDDTGEKSRCPYPDCRKVFKDLKAHQLTHQTERPEKCPIASCEYHVKGFARKYDKNRHTLTHYKGTMVCGFCPGSGSAAEKSFNRADVFKRHLTSVHAVEQSPPNSRKKSPSAVALSGKNLAGYPSGATGKCSTCSTMFNNAQEFYEHLDDCVLRIVQQEDPSEAINAKRLAEVENDPDVLATLGNHTLPTSASQSFDPQDEEDEDYDVGDADDDDFTLRPSQNRSFRSQPTLGRPNPNRPSASTLSGGISKSRGLTRSKGGVTLHTKSGRKKRKDFPNSWGCAAPQMRIKKRVLCCFDGTRRLWKDEMMLDSDFEVRLKLAGNSEGLTGNEYITDLDVQTLRRAEALHNATNEEKGPDYIGDDLSNEDLQELMRIKDES